MGTLSGTAIHSHTASSVQTLLTLSSKLEWSAKRIHSRSAHLCSQKAAWRHTFFQLHLTTKCCKHNQLAAGLWLLSFIALTLKFLKPPVLCICITSLCTSCTAWHLILQASNLVLLELHKSPSSKSVLIRNPIMSENQWLKKIFQQNQHKSWKCWLNVSNLEGWWWPRLEIQDGLTTKYSREAACVFCDLVN